MESTISLLDICPPSFSFVKNHWLFSSFFYKNMSMKGKNKSTWQIQWGIILYLWWARLFFWIASYLYLDLKNIDARPQPSVESAVLVFISLVCNLYQDTFSCTCNVNHFRPQASNNVIAKLEKETKNQLRNLKQI